MTAPYVNYYHSEMPGAPGLSGAAGAMLAVLDACLADGWGLATATDLSVVGGVATVTFATGPVAAPRATVEIAGASIAELNGKHRVTSVSTNTVSFDAPGVPDGTATGTITCKIAASGWEKAFTGTNKRAYRSLDPASTRLYLRVDDTGTTNARWRGYEVMTDVDSGTGDFPTVAQQAAPGLWAHKANGTSGTRKWILLADSKRFWLLVQYNSSYPTDYAPLFFGDIETFKAGDAYHCMINAPVSDQSSSSQVGGDSTYATRTGSGSGSGYVARSYIQTGGAVPVYRQAAGPDRADNQSGGPSFPAGPDPVNNALYAAPLLVNDGDTSKYPYRGRLPGFLFIPQYLGSGFTSGATIAGQGDLAGRELMYVGYGTGYTSSGYRYAFDISGPWG